MTITISGEELDNMRDMVECNICGRCIENVIICERDHTCCHQCMKDLVEDATREGGSGRLRKKCPWCKLLVFRQPRPACYKNELLQAFERLKLLQEKVIEVPEELRAQWPTPRLRRGVPAPETPTDVVLPHELLGILFYFLLLPYVLATCARFVDYDSKYQRSAGRHGAMLFTSDEGETTLYIVGVARVVLWIYKQYESTILQRPPLTRYERFKECLFGLSYDWVRFVDWLLLVNLRLHGAMHIASFVEKLLQYAGWVTPCCYSPGEDLSFEWFIVVWVYKRYELTLFQMPPLSRYERLKKCLFVNACDGLRFVNWWLLENLMLHVAMHIAYSVEKLLQYTGWLTPCPSPGLYSWIAKRAYETYIGNASCALQTMTEYALHLFMRPLDHAGYR